MEYDIIATAPNAIHFFILYDRALSYRITIIGFSNELIGLQEQLKLNLLNLQSQG